MTLNPLELAWWYWLGTRECAHPQGLRFDSLQCQYRWANLASSKKIYNYDIFKLRKQKPQEKWQNNSRFKL